MAIDKQKLEELFEDASKKGAIVSIIHFDAFAKDEAQAKNLLVNHIAMLSKENGVLYCEGNIDGEVIKTEENQFSAIAEATVVAERFQALFLIAIKYAPIAIEVLKPSKIELTMEDAQNILLDASQASQQFASYFLAKSMTKEEQENYKKEMQKRSETGKNILEQNQRQRII